MRVAATTGTRARRRRGGTGTRGPGRRGAGRGRSPPRCRPEPRRPSPSGEGPAAGSPGRPTRPSSPRAGAEAADAAAWRARPRPGRSRRRFNHHGPRLESRLMLDRSLVEEVLRHALGRGGQFAEVFVEEKSSVTARLDDGKIEEFTSGLDRGAGVRVGRGTSFGYAYSNRLDRDALLEAADAAAASIPDGEEPVPEPVDLTTLEPDIIHAAARPASGVAKADKVLW